MKRNSLPKWMLLLKRVVIAFRILTGKYKHFVVLSVDEKNLKKLIGNVHFDQNNVVDIACDYLMLQEFTGYSLIKHAASGIDDIDMILGKAEIEADVFGDKDAHSPER